MEAMSHSPVSPGVYQPMNRGAVQPPPPTYERRPSVKEDVSDSLTQMFLQLLTVWTGPAACTEARPHVSV